MRPLWSLRGSGKSVSILAMVANHNQAEEHLCLLRESRQVTGDYPTMGEVIMRVLEQLRSESKMESCDNQDALKITVKRGDNTITLSFHDGEPEDNTISRNFSGIINILTVMNMAYEAGRAGEKLEVEKEESDDI